MIYSIQSLAPICQALRHQGRSLVLATGFFDLLHQEHINFLTAAKKRGDTLIVAVESDARARLLKGEGRPVESQTLRCEHILSQNLADYVIALGDDFNTFEAYESLMATVMPKVYAVSSHTSHQKSKQFLTEKYGGTLEVVHEFNPAVSTTQILNEQNRDIIT